MMKYVVYVKTGFTYYFCVGVCVCVFLMLRACLHVVCCAGEARLARRGGGHKALVLRVLITLDHHREHRIALLPRDLVFVVVSCRLLAVVCLLVFVYLMF